MVGTTRFELATSPTPILEMSQSEQLSETHQYVRERKQSDATLIGPVMDPQLDPQLDPRNWQRGTNGNQRGQREQLNSRNKRLRKSNSKFSWPTEWIQHCRPGSVG